MTMLFPKPVTLVSKKIRDSANGEECSLRMPWCDRTPETTVFCHIRAFGSGGMGTKPIDIHGFYGCHECHRREKDAGWDDILRAMMETQRKLIEKGLICTK